MQASASFKGSRYGAPGEASAARNELLAGAAPAEAGPTPAYKEAMSNQQLMTYAVDTHKETTSTAQRALKIVESTKQIQASTLDNLQQQGQQMEKIEEDFDRIGAELTYSQKLLRAMRVCCCVDICCPGCADPKREAADTNWRQADKQKSMQRNPTFGRAPTMGRSPTMTAPSQQQMAAMPPSTVPQAPGTYAAPNTDGLSEIGFAQEAEVIQTETQKQNQYLDEISSGLEQLKQGAYAMQGELSRQEAHVDSLTGDAYKLDAKLGNVNREGFRGL